jgi:hypothetical protein
MCLVSGFRPVRFVAISLCACAFGGALSAAEEPIAAATRDQSRDDATPANSRRLAEQDGWVVAWDEQHPIQHSSGIRMARLRLFPDGRLLVLQGVLDPIAEARIPTDDVNSLVDWLIDEQAARKRAAFKVKQADGIQTEVEWDPLPSALWDQHAERVAVRRKDAVYDLIRFSPPRDERANDRFGPESQAGPLTDEGRARLLALSALAIAGGPDELKRHVALANQSLHQQVPDTPVEIAPNHLRSAGFDSDGTRALFFEFAKERPGVGFPRGEMAVRISPEDSAYVDRARYWTGESSERAWGLRNKLK